MGDNINETKLKTIGDKGVLAMICDSTNIFTEGRSGSEKDVNESMLRIFEQQKKRIIYHNYKFYFLFQHNLLSFIFAL